jgi:hypothetical protein
MSLKDYEVDNDHFTVGSGRHYAGFCFPCCLCASVTNGEKDEPCRACGHNVNAVKESFEKKGVK